MSYVAALVSAVTMGAVYLLDMVMAGRTYDEDRPSQPMFVSSLFCLIPGIIGIFLLEWDNPPPQSAMVMGFSSGVILMIANWLYFIVVYSESGECTETSCFETSSVMVIALVTLCLGALGVAHHDSISGMQWLGIFVGVCGLIAVSLYGDSLTYVPLKHRVMLIGFMLFGAGYEMLIDRAIYLAASALPSAMNAEQTGFLQVSPFFWFGLATGVVAILPKGEWKALQERMPVLRKEWRVIVFAEILALITFGAMVFGFAEGHVAVIALIAGTFPVIVMIGGVVLRRKFGFDTETFPEIQHPWKKTIAVAMVIVGAVLVSCI